MENMKVNFLIIGGGMVGLSIANQLKKKYPKKIICIVDKEYSLGNHSSGRNSGVLHAGIYYAPNTLKAKLCVEGAKRLKEWVIKENLPILNCGKVISPQNLDLDSQLDILLKRGIDNGAKIRMIDKNEFSKLVPDGRTASGRAIWSPNTNVVSPKLVISRLFRKLKENGIQFILNTKILKVDKNKKSIIFGNNQFPKSKNFNIEYDFLFNTAGLQADKVAKNFQIGKEFFLLPFRGNYWKLNPDSGFNFNCNLYPVPDLNMPFLGVHVTPSTDGFTYLGPSAIPAFGSENYQGLEGFEIFKSINSFSIIINQILKDEDGFRKYAQEQSTLAFKYFFFKSAKLLIPKLKISDLIPSQKVGIRPQLYSKKTKKLIKDFHIEFDGNHLHVLNAISPAFTASFAFADFLLKKYL